MAKISDNLREIKTRIMAACNRSGRDPASVSILAVSKFHPDERIREAAEAGLALFGESRQQEAKTKLPALKSLGIWHFIGHLQSNKAKSVAELFDVVESVNSLELAKKLSQAASGLGRELGIYAQFNISGEVQKHGFEPADSAKVLAELSRFPGLKLEGIMGMAAPGDLSAARKSFQLLKSLRPLGSALKLSMGMSDDFDVAIEEGSDLVRIGTLLFR